MSIEYACNQNHGGHWASCKTNSILQRGLTIGVFNVMWTGWNKQTTFFVNYLFSLICGISKLQLGICIKRKKMIEDIFDRLIFPNPMCTHVRKYRKGNVSEHSKRICWVVSWQSLNSSSTFGRYEWVHFAVNRIFRCLDYFLL